MPERLILVTMQYKVQVCSCLLAGIACFYPSRGMEVCLVSDVCCQAEVSAMG